MNRLIQKLDQIKTLADASKAARLQAHPVKYIKAMLHREFVYRLTRRNFHTAAYTFFDKKINLILPASIDVYLTGAKTHDSEIRLSKYIIRSLEEDSVFVDVGAHFGYYTLLANHLIGKKGAVHSFEASTNIYQVLMRNVAHAKSIKANHLLVSDSSSSEVFYEFPTLYSEYNSINKEQYQDQAWFQKVKINETKIQSISLDDYLDRYDLIPDVIKIDVEGAELSVIRGLQRTMKDLGPVIIMEYLHSDRNNEVHQEADLLMKKYGYQSFIISDDGILEAVEDISGYLLQHDLESENVVYER